LLSSTIASQDDNLDESPDQCGADYSGQPDVGSRRSLT
jgi:hypothetical protein